MADVVAFGFALPVPDLAAKRASMAQTWSGEVKYMIPFTTRGVDLS